MVQALSLAIPKRMAEQAELAQLRCPETLGRALYGHPSIAKKSYKNTHLYR